MSIQYEVLLTRPGLAIVNKNKHALLGLYTCAHLLYNSPSHIPDHQNLPIHLDG